MLMIEGVIENVVFGNIEMPGELIRLILAFAGVCVATYYDIFNKKNIPDVFLYGFLAVAFIVNAVLYQEDLFLFSLGVALFLSAIGYLFYRAGQLGGADIFVLASIMLLLPIHPTFLDMPFGMPFIFSVMIFGGVLFALYVMASFGLKLRERETEPQFVYLLMIIPYAIIAYLFLEWNLILQFYFIILTVLFIAMIFFMIYRKDLTALLAEKMDVGQVEPEDVLALELMEKEIVKKYDLKRLATEKEIERMKEVGVGEVWVYTKLPPFLPFILAGMFLALFLSKALLFG